MKSFVNGLSIYQVILLALCTLIMGLPLIDQPYLGEYDFKRMGVLVVITITVLALLRCEFYIIPVPKAYKVLFMILLGALMCSIYFSPSVKFALIEVVNFTLLGLFSVFFWQINKENHLTFVRCFSLMIIIVSGIYIVGVAAGYLAAQIQGLKVVWSDLFIGFQNVRFFNQYQIWTFPFMIYCYLTVLQKRPLYRSIGFSILSLWWTLLFLSASRGAILAIALSFTIIFILYRARVVSIIKLGLFTAISGYIAYCVFFHWLPNLSQQEVSIVEINSLYSPTRIVLWEHAISLLKEHKLTGIGPMQFAWYPGVKSAHPHNSLIQIFTEWGIISGIIVIFFISTFLKRCFAKFSVENISNLEHEESLMIVSVLCSFLAGAMYSLVSGVIVMPMGQILSALIVGMMVTIYFSPISNNEIEYQAISFNYLQKGAIIFLPIMLWCAVWPSLQERLTNSVDLSVYHTTHPRFWQIGGIPH